ncbi:MAG: flagellar hook-basal body complex protein FliE [Gemmatimonadota bacterium]
MSDPIGAVRGVSSSVAQGRGADSARRYEFDIGAGSPDPAGDTSFGQSLTRAINSVSDAQDNSADHVRRFLAGEQVELHQVMAASAEAGLALDLLVELRNKVTEAFRTLINMQS